MSALMQATVTCFGCRHWFVEWPGDQVGLCRNSLSKHYGWMPSGTDGCIQGAAMTAADHQVLYRPELEVPA